VIVECPACRTRYRTDGAGLIEGTTFFECTKEECRHVFPYVPRLPLEGNHTTTPFANFSPQPQFLEKSQPFDSEEIPTIDAEEIRDTPTPSRTPDDSTSFPDPFGELEDFPAPEVPFVAEGTEENENLQVAPRQERPQNTEVSFSMRPFLVFLGFIILGHAALAFYCLSHPDETEAMLAQLPLLGSLFATERASTQQVALLDLKGGFWLTKDGRRVFAVSGKVVNDAPLPARNIQIEGVIYDADGKIVGQRMIFCGTETAPAVLERLTIREIGILQNLVPPKQFNVPAGQSVNFLIVFTNPLSPPAQFSCWVIAAQFG
jgi:hypothetical protein